MVENNLNDSIIHGRTKERERERQFGNGETITFMLCPLLPHFQETNTCIFMLLKYTL